MAPSDFTKRKSEKLAEEGYRHLQDRDAEAALKVAAELETLRFTAAFEIAALAHAQLGNLEAAAATLRRGLDIAPTVWINWQLLGNYVSDLKRYDEAASAYDVVADSVEQALTFVERMEATAVRGNLLVEEHEVLADRSDDPKGVYKRSVRHYYDREE
jgi:tetratricopeptide (TPR) repeat protein